MKAIVVDHIEKSYAIKKTKVPALKGISFDVPQGELFGLIGPDGAGKTTLFRILTTLILPDIGSASVNGLDVVKDFLKFETSPEGQAIVEEEGFFKITDEYRGLNARVGL